MSLKYGITIDGLLVETFDTPEEAYEAGQFAYEESGIFHEVVEVHLKAKGLSD